VATVEQKMALDISIDDFAAQREVLIEKLALQYGVDPSLITLEVAATRRRQLQNAIEITVTIATSDGAGNLADLAQIEQAVSAIDDAALSTTIGEVMGTPVTVVSQPPVISTTEIEVPFRCPKGKWCTAGLVVDCPLGSYNPLENQDFATACVVCPLNSYTLETNSTSRSECVCDEDFYDANASTAVDQALVDAMVAAGTDPITMMADVVECMVCPVGSDCSRLGATLEALPLVAGYYRLDDTTNDVRVCPDARANCSSTFGTDECQSSSGCQGGVGEVCAPGLKGVYCELCDRSDGRLVYYKPAADDSVATCAECGGTLGASVAVALGGLATLCVLMVLVLYLRKHMSIRLALSLKRFNDNFTPRNKCKIVVTFYQLATKVPTVYEVSLPTDVKAVLDALSSVFSFGMQGIATTPLECLGLAGYTPRLIAYIIVPIVLVVLVVVVVAMSSCFGKGRRSTTASHTDASKTADKDHGAAFHLHDAIYKAERTPSLFEKTLPAVLTLLFIMYPMVTKVAFDGFPCYSFTDKTVGFLRSDVSLECGLSDAQPDTRPMGLVWLAVILYPVGITAFCGLLLLRASTDIIAGHETPLTRAIGFLHREYQVTAFWWELMEMLRKFLLVGLFVNLMPGSIMQIAIGTMFTAAFLMVQLQAQPYKTDSDDYLAAASSFSLLMVFFCSVIFKYASLTASEDLQDKMSVEQKGNFIINNTLLSVILIASVLASLAFSAVLLIVQIIVEIKDRAKLRRLKYVVTGKWVECKTLHDTQAFHLFLSHAWPAAQDRMRIVKARFLECLPSCRTFLDVDDLKSGSGTAEVDKSECILVFCTKAYFDKKNSMKELYRAVCQRRPILAMLEPDESQDGGLDEEAVTVLLTDERLDKFKLCTRWASWKDESELLPTAFDHAPGGADVAAALFSTPPVEWNRLPHFQDVTIRLIAEKGILHGATGELYLQGEAATGKVALPPPLKGREYHLFCSEFNAGAKELAEELRNSSVWVTKGKKASALLTFTSDVTKIAACDHMLVLLDTRTWTSGEATAKFVEHIHSALRTGVHLNCVHEYPAVVGPPRHECEFAKLFDDDWTPAHLTGGKTNLYKEIALALKGVEWRQPGLVALASKLVASVAKHKPVIFAVPDTSARAEESPPEIEDAQSLSGRPPGKSDEPLALTPTPLPEPTATAPATTVVTAETPNVLQGISQDLSDRLRRIISPAASSTTTLGGLEA